MFRSRHTEEATTLPDRSQSQSARQFTRPSAPPGRPAQSASRWRGPSVPGTTAGWWRGRRSARSSWWRTPSTAPRRPAPWSQHRTVRTSQQGIGLWRLIVNPSFYVVFHRSIPQLIPEEICREVPKQLCQTVFLSPRTVKVAGFYHQCNIISF